MKYLFQGNMNLDRFNILISLTSIKSEDKISALKAHLVDGRSEVASYTLNGVDGSNFREALNTLNSVAEKVEKIKEIDLARFNLTLKG